MSEQAVTAQFERYDDEFSSLIQQIETSLHQGDTETGGNSGDSTSSQQYTANLLQQCDDLIKQMSLEARSASSTTQKRSLLDKVRSYKSKYQTLQAESERQGLLGGNNKGGFSNNNNSRNQRDQLLQNENMVGQQNETLERARRTMEETEAVALEITDELGHNREKLVSAHGRIREVGGLTGRARRILTQMSQRATQQKLILYGVALALVLGFVFLLYTMWK